MSDNDDAMSEKAPDGWTSMFNKVSGAKPDSKSGGGSARGKSSKKEQQSAGWLGGFFGKVEEESHKSSISSDTPPRKDSDEESAGNVNDDDRKKWDTDKDAGAGDEDGNISDESLHAYEVDSDGFSVNQQKASKGSDSSSDGDSIKLDEEVEVEELPEFKANPVVRSSRRRERIQNRMNFTVAHEAAELAVPDPIVEPPKPEVPDQSPEANTAAWWQVFVPAVPVPPEELKSESPTEIKPEEKKEPEQTAPSTDAPQPEATGGWSSWFGGAKEESVSPRSVLPVIRPPPDIPALAELNTFFAPPPLSESAIELLGPRPLARYEGRLRGWPRGLAPYWSTHDRFQPTRQRAFSQPSELSGVSALAMFRVT